MSVALVRCRINPLLWGLMALETRSSSTRILDGRVKYLKPMGQQGTIMKRALSSLFDHV